MPDELIDRAQSELGVIFPEEYTEFLSEFGAVLVNGAQVYGIPDHEKNSPPLWQNVVSVNQQLRSWEQAGTEHPSFIAISDDGTGVYFFLDTSCAPETKVLAVGPGVEKVVSTSLYDFIVDLSGGKVFV